MNTIQNATTQVKKLTSPGTFKTIQTIITLIFTLLKFWLAVTTTKNLTSKKSYHCNLKTPISTYPAINLISILCNV